VKFWDASAIIPLCLLEPRTARVRAIVEEDSAIVAWWATPIECSSALARLRRDAALTRQHEDEARGIVLRLAADWTEIQPGRQVRDAAARILLLHPLRAADALQLAAGLVWVDGRPAQRQFVCFDERLREAAQREGFDVRP